jgi:glucose/arabinose dehydrogenase
MLSKRVFPIALLALACEGASAAAQDQVLRVPAGFRVTVFAPDVGGVRNLTLGPGGVVYAARTRAGTIVRLPDANHNGVADSVVTVVAGLSGPFGIAFRGDTMYVAENTAIVRFNPGSTQRIVVVPNIPGGRGHSTRTIVFGADGKMYVSVGSSCNLCDEADSMRAAVVQFNPDGTGGRIFARGLRNSVGLAVQSTTGEIWATNNDRDNLGDDIPPERINIIKDHKFYGWPQCYLPGQRNPEYNGADCSTVEPPAITFQAHSAPLGLTFYTGTAFPADYRGDAFVAYHGSWNRTVPTGAKVVRVQVENGRPVGIDDFVTGWQLPDGSRWGRPVSVVTATDGALLISDDMGGKVWRVSYGP